MREPPHRPQRFDQQRRHGFNGLRHEQRIAPASGQQPFLCVQSLQSPLPRAVAHHRSPAQPGSHTVHSSSDSWLSSASSLQVLPLRTLFGLQGPLPHAVAHYLRT